MVKWRGLRCWLLLAAATSAAGQSSYVGSMACAACHRQLYDNYVRTAMGRSMRPATDPIDLARVRDPVMIPNGSRVFEIRRQGNALYENEYEPGPARQPVFRASHKLEYAVGSGVNGSTYIVRRGNHLFEAPLSFFSRAGAWELSPGYESGNPGFGRPIAAGCIVCHSGRPQPIPNREGLFGDPPFQELAIGCENCHGPGSSHIQAGGAAKAIVNPARLPPRLAEDICMSCHQAGDTRVLMPGRSYSDFRPGAPLADTLAIFKIPLDPQAARLQDLLEHHFAIQLSRCFSAGGGKLGCLTCHNPHAAPSKETAGDYYREKCLTCHADRSCPLPQARRVREAADHCTQCHMPKREIRIISHSALTNHRIIAHADEALPARAFQQTTPDLPDLIFLNTTASRRPPKLALLEAYGELMTRQPRYRARYLELLAELAESSPHEPVVQAALGQKAFLDSGPDANQQAIDHLSEAVQLGFTSPSVYENLAEALVRSGQTPAAIEILKKGIELMPYAPRLHKFLAVRYIDLKQYADAKQVMEKYIELFPDDDFVRGLLRNVESQR